MAAALLTSAAGLRSPKSPEVTFNDASLYIKGGPDQPVIVQGYTEAHDLNNFSWELLKDELITPDYQSRGLDQAFQALVRIAMKSDVAASMLLNMRYAVRHRYHYVLFSYTSTPTALSSGACFHGGIRQPSHWCKVQALQSARAFLASSPLFMWLDSDVMVRNMGIALPDYLTSAARCKQTTLAPEHASVFSWVNAHWNHCPSANSGALVFKTGDDHGMKAFLSQWWLSREHNPTNETTNGITLDVWDSTHDQRAFNEALQSSEGHRGVVIDENLFQDIPSQFLVHRCKRCNWMPNTRALVNKVMAENNVTINMLHDAMLEIVAVAIA